jgi:hypothetical protein
VLVSLGFLARMTRRSASAMGIPMPSDGETLEPGFSVLCVVFPRLASICGGGLL